MPSQTDPETPAKPGTSKPEKQPPVAPRRIRWRSGTAILLAGAIAETIIQVRYADDSTLRVMFTLYLVPATMAALLVWWAFRSGFSWKTRLIGLGVVAVPAALFLSLCRIERFEGDMRPRLAWRWEPTAEELAAAYWKKAGRSADGIDQSSGIGAVLLGSPGITLPVGEADWPRFRGAQGDGVVRNLRIRTDWQENPPQEVWRHPVGPGWSSFAVVGRRLFTQEQRGEFEAVVCYDAQTGEEIWAHEDRARHETSMGGIGPRATPTVYGSHVYSLGATGILNCLDPLTGEAIWSRNILQDAGVKGRSVDPPPWGVAGSPLVFEGTVVVNAGGRQGRAVIAYDRLTGEIKWASGDHPAGYAAPRLETIGGVQQVIVFDADGVAGYDPIMGEELWRSPSWTNSPRINVAQPIVRDERYVLIGTGYGTGSALWEVASDDGRWSVTSVWERPGRFKLKFNGAIYKEGYVYGLDEGILACIEYSTGRQQWKRGRYGHGQLLLIDEQDLLLIQAEKGDVVLVAATPDEHRELVRFTALDDVTWNHPVLNRGFLYVRNYKEAACYDLRPQ